MGDEAPEKLLNSVFDSRKEDLESATDAKFGFYGEGSVVGGNDGMGEDDDSYTAYVTAVCDNEDINLNRLLLSRSVYLERQRFEEINCM